jgi:DNA-binding helix-hairpin-helix protein with protein kinase domain
MTVLCPWCAHQIAIALEQCGERITCAGCRHALRVHVMGEYVVPLPIVEGETERERL